jgi:hypothetical protein
MARGIFHKPVRYRPIGSRLTYEIGASARVQVVKRAILNHAVSIGAAIEIETNYSPRKPNGGPSDGTRAN